MNAKTTPMVQALLLASARGDRRLVEKLLASGAQVNGADQSGVTALHVAAECGWSGVVELLLERGADHGSRTSTGWTPLHGAAAAGQVDCLLTLLENGADPDAEDATGATALDQAVRWRRDIVRHVLAAPTHGPSAFDVHRQCEFEVCSGA